MKTGLTDYSEIKMLNKLKCWLGWHGDPENFEKISEQVALFNCEHCKKQFIFNHHLQAVLPYNKEAKDFYNKFNGSFIKGKK